MIIPSVGLRIICLGVPGYPHLTGRIGTIVDVGLDNFDIRWDGPNNSIQLFTARGPCNPYSDESIYFDTFIEQSIVSNMSEKPCKQCQRKNFIADKKCWWCETLNPCTA
jgi:hypothetical protein